MRTGCSSSSGATRSRRSCRRTTSSSSSRVPGDGRRGDGAMERNAGSPRRRWATGGRCGEASSTPSHRGAGEPGARVIVLGIDTSTNQTSIALGDEHETLAAASVRRLAQAGPPRPRARAAPRLDRGSSCRTSAASPSASVRACTRACASGVEAGKALAQVLHAPIVGMSSLDVLAFGVRHTRRLIGAVIDARRREVFSAFYRTGPGRRAPRGRVPGRLARRRWRPSSRRRARRCCWSANGAILYRQELERGGARAEFASAALAHPSASALVEALGPAVRPRGDRPARPTSCRST